MLNLFTLRIAWGESWSHIVTRQILLRELCDIERCNKSLILKLEQQGRIKPEKFSSSRINDVIIPRMFITWLKMSFRSMTSWILIFERLCQTRYLWIEGNFVAISNKSVLKYTKYAHTREACDTVEISRNLESCTPEARGNYWKLGLKLAYSVENTCQLISMQQRTDVQTRDNTLINIIPHSVTRGNVESY